MVDRLHLIAEVFRRPGLWDLQTEQYRARACSQELWKEVAASMGPNVTVDVCKSKWKNLRDAYRAEIKRIEIRIEKDILNGTYDPKNDYSCKWAYFEHMKFIKDINKPRRTNYLPGNLYSPSNDIYDDDDKDLKQLSEFHNIDSIKLEPNVESNEEPYSLNVMDDSSCSQTNSEKNLKEAVKEQQQQIETSSQPIPAIKPNLSSQNSAKPQTAADDNPKPSCCKCPKRSYEQMHFLEDLEKEEQNLIKSTCLEITRSNDLAHVGDSDYNFLVSFLPQLKKMNELQNLQFRAKMTDIMLNIMYQPINSNVTPVASFQN